MRDVIAGVRGRFARPVPNRVWRAGATQAGAGSFARVPPMIRWFIGANRRACNRIEDFLPDSFTASLLALHMRAAARIVNERPGQLVIDAGGGKKSPFVRFCEDRRAAQIVAIDISEEELRRNDSADHRVVADLSRSMPLGDGEADLLVSRSVIEHLPDVEVFFAESSRVLKPGGHIVHVLPCKFAPFSVINRIIPNRVAKMLLYYFFPEWKEACGFRAYYDRCYYSGIKALAERSGFQIVQLRLRYYQSIYYKFFVPLYLVMLLYDSLVAALGIKNLSGQLFLVARKR